MLPVTHSQGLSAMADGTENPSRAGSSGPAPCRRGRRVAQLMDQYCPSSSSSCPARTQQHWMFLEPCLCAHGAPPLQGQPKLSVTPPSPLCHPSAMCSARRGRAESSVGAPRSVTQPRSSTDRLAGTAQQFQDPASILIKPN